MKLRLVVLNARVQRCIPRHSETFFFASTWLTLTLIASSSDAFGCFRCFDVSPPYRRRSPTSPTAWAPRTTAFANAHVSIKHTVLKLSDLMQQFRLSTFSKMLSAAMDGLNSGASVFTAVLSFSVTSDHRVMFRNAELSVISLTGECKISPHAHVLQFPILTHPHPIIDRN